MGKHTAATGVLKRYRGRNHSSALSATRHGPEPGPALAAAKLDQSIRWRPGERLDELFEDRCDRLRAAGKGLPEGSGGQDRPQRGHPVPSCTNLH